MQVEKGQLKSILTGELGYSEVDAEVYAGQYPELHETLGVPMEQWLEDRTFEDVKVDGVSLKEVMEVHGSNFVQATRQLNDLLVKPLSDGDKQALVDYLQNPPIYE